MKLYKTPHATPSWHTSAVSAKAAVFEAKTKWRERVAAAKAEKNKEAAKEPFLAKVVAVDVPTKKELLLDWLNVNVKV